MEVSMKRQRFIALLVMIAFMLNLTAGPLYAKTDSDRSNSEKMYDPANFTIEGLSDTVYVGQTGNAAFTPKPIEGIEIEAEIVLKSWDTSIFRIDEDGRWEALAPGFVNLTVSAVYSEETTAALEKAGYTKSRFEIGRFVRVEVRAVPQQIFRLYNKNNGEHFYTANKNEKAYLESIGWRYEGIAWLAPTIVESESWKREAESNKNLQLDPVYRLYNRGTGDHHYTKNKHEKDYLLQNGWEDEGIGWYSEREDIGVPLYRQYNPNAVVGTHNYTTNLKENNYLVGLGWREEGIAWYGVRYES